MKEFQVMKNYYIHEFSAIQSWFGNRGYVIEEGDLLEWYTDFEYLYYLPNTSCDESLWGDEVTQVVMVPFNSLYLEPFDFIEYKDSPIVKQLPKKESNMNDKQKLYQSIIMNEGAFESFKLHKSDEKIAYLINFSNFLDISLCMGDLISVGYTIERYINITKELYDTLEDEGESNESAL